LESRGDTVGSHLQPGMSLIEKFDALIRTVHAWRGQAGLFGVGFSDCHRRCSNAGASLSVLSIGENTAAYRQGGLEIKKPFSEGLSLIRSR
jgi:hypothetical protein